VCLDARQGKARRQGKDRKSCVHIDRRRETDDKQASCHASQEDIGLTNKAVGRAKKNTNVKAGVQGSATGWWPSTLEASAVRYSTTVKGIDYGGRVCRWGVVPVTSRWDGKRLDVWGGVTGPVSIRVTERRLASQCQFTKADGTQHAGLERPAGSVCRAGPIGRRCRQWRWADGWGNDGLACVCQSFGGRIILGELPRRSSP
jgi:hypothetical protein